jgi:mono/diheme cytochrome c family protein
VKASALAALAIGLSAAAGCRGSTSEDPPVHLAPDMDWQAHGRPQEASPVGPDGKPLFADGRIARPIVSGTIAQGRLHEDAALWRGHDENGRHIRRMPVDAVLAAHDKASLAELLPRGEERFNIYCAPCHDKSGEGEGMVIQRSQGGFPPPTKMSAAAVTDMPDGQIFDVISHGVRNMPGYAAQIPAADRWAIVLWVRVLGKSQGAKLDDVPAAERAKIAEPDAKEGGK